MMLVKTYIGPSDIQGVGIFASERIPAGTVIWEFNERFDICLDESAVESLPAYMREYVEVYSFVHPHRPDVLVIEADNGRFMNHSDTPNTDFRTDVGIALRDIQPGEELTCDYAELEIGFEGEFPARTWTTGPAQAGVLQYRT
jgi:uncharacterized protein